MNKRVKTEALDFLFKTILTLESEEECYDFFDDLCTVKELQSMAQRMEVAMMLKENKTYVEISKKTGASTVTISRVNRILQYGNESLNQSIERSKKIGAE